MAAKMLTELVLKMYISKYIFEVKNNLKLYLNFANLLNIHF